MLHRDVVETPHPKRMRVIETLMDFSIASLSELTGKTNDPWEEK